jgi:hypothetical protein
MRIGVIGLKCTLESLMCGFKGAVLSYGYLFSLSLLMSIYASRK